MKALSMNDQINACLRHANRNGLKIQSFEFYPNWGVNHQVIARLPQKEDGGYPYFSIAVLIAEKRIQREGCFNGSYNLANAIEH